VAERRAGGVPDPEAEEVPAGAAPGEPAAAELGDRLREAQETLDSIRRGDFDALLIGEPGGEQLYTLATAERPYRVMVERMKLGALTLSPAGDVLWANGTFAALAGQPLERVIGARFDTLLAAAGDGMPAAGLLVDGGGEAELELARGDDPPVPVAVSVTEIVDQGTRSFCAIVTDLTHQRVHERLRDSERRLREMDRRKDEFLAMLGHELRNPLAPIAHAAELLRREAGELSQRGEWALAVIERQLLHVRRMVDDLLDIGRITRGRVELRRGAVDLAEVVTAAMMRSAPTASARLRANATSTSPSRNSDELTMTAWAPASRTARARSTLRIPPPTRQGSRAQIDAASASLAPRPRAASRSMSWTRGNAENFRIHGSGSGAWMARRSPCTSWTTWPSWRSIDGISMGYRRTGMP
jgi:signal transduction histidine kinase